MTPFFRQPALIWLPDRETESGESALRGFVIMEEQYPPRRAPNEIFREDIVVPVNERYDSQLVRNYVMNAYYRMCCKYREVHKDDGHDPA